MEFEWDEAKRLINLEKHGIDFGDLAEFWEGDLLNPAAVRDAGDELRLLALGVTRGDGRIIAVVYTVRGSAIRLISARRASRYEREVFRSRFGYGE
ncbi:BrnT family toxin [Blastomonas sp. UPD001]|jgi:uncharacterized protein|uniref:BrnT family toxin n=1 Tax=Blastomonas sp. UPD001 TaxID=2217673 RepID=UPI000E350D46|nr:BrnT family toxin [Blastomonas sp. UPD001]